ncbi:MAG: hypothetical protein U0414_26390 [Polyangiaceae bacterium]
MSAVALRTKPFALRAAGYASSNAASVAGAAAARISASDTHTIARVVSGTAIASPSPTSTSPPWSREAYARSCHTMLWVAPAPYRPICSTVTDATRPRATPRRTVVARARASRPSARTRCSAAPATRSVFTQRIERASTPIHSRVSIADQARCSWTTA